MSFTCESGQLGRPQERRANTTITLNREAWVAASRGLTTTKFLILFSYTEIPSPTKGRKKKFSKSMSTPEEEEEEIEKYDQEGGSVEPEDRRV